MSFTEISSSEWIISNELKVKSKQLYSLLSFTPLINLESEYNKSSNVAFLVLVLFFDIVQSSNKNSGKISYILILEKIFLQKFGH